MLKLAFIFHCCRCGQRQFAASDSVASRGFSRLGVWSNFGSEAPGALSERKGLTPLAEASGEVASLFEQRQRKALEAEEASGPPGPAVLCAAIAMHCRGCTT